MIGERVRGTSGLKRGSAGAATLALLMVCLAPIANADVVSRREAPHASTIAEYHVHEGGVSVELTIGPSDLEAFRNLLPDKVHRDLGHAREPLSSRLATFFAQDLVVQAGDGGPLPGVVVESFTHARVRLDEITGAPKADAKTETIVLARLEYPFTGLPQNLTIGGSAVAEAAIGFVLYHSGIAVNDVRYLSREQTVDLNWDDPWYTKFRVPAFRRVHFAPMSGYLYVAPLEVRKEIIVRPKDLNRWVDLGLAGRTTIPTELQDAIKRDALEFLQQHQPVRINGKNVLPQLTRIDFLERTLRSGEAPDPSAELSLDGAVLGAIFTYPVDGLPRTVTMEWDLFNEQLQSVPAATLDRSGESPVQLNPQANILEWKRNRNDPRGAGLLAVSPPPTTLTQLLHMLRWPLLVAIGVLAAWSGVGILRKGRHMNLRAGLLVIAGVASIATFWWGQEAMSAGMARKVVGGLLHNIYIAHDFPQEEQILDALRESVTAELLNDIYRDTRRSLELADQGGARARFNRVKLVEFTTESGYGKSFVATATWIVSGYVGHWGHLHEQAQRYRAELDVMPVNGTWKVAALKPVQE